MRVLIVLVVEVDGRLQVSSLINGHPHNFAVPVGTNYGELRTYISNNITEEPLPFGWLREFDV